MTAQQIKIHLFANFLKICISVVIFRASLIVEKLRLRCHLYTECSLKAKQKKNVQNKAGKKKRKILKIKATQDASLRISEINVHRPGE